MVGILTGMPADVRMIASSVGENSRSDDAFAASNLRFAMLGRASDSPSSILISVGVSAMCGVVVPAPSFEPGVSAKALNRCHTSGHQHSFTTFTTFTKHARAVTCALLCCIPCIGNYIVKQPVQKTPLGHDICLPDFAAAPSTHGGFLRLRDESRKSISTNIKINIEIVQSSTEEKTRLWK
jgi:hypothetical protein